MSDRIEGQRDSHGDKWSWGPPSGAEPPRGGGSTPRFPWRPVLLVVAAVALVGTGVGLLALANDDSGNSSNDGGTTPTGSNGTTRTRGSTQSPEPGAASLTPDPATGVALYAWSRGDNEWVEDSVPEATGYSEGDAIAVLMQIDGTTAGTFYETIIRYQCGSDGGAGFDFLASPAEVDSNAVLTAPGPGRIRPDSTVPIPEDPTITFDEGSPARFQLWGATFQQSLQGPLPPGQCEGEKEFHLIAVAVGDAVSLVWAGHLASAEDWGANKGSASADGPLTIEVTVVGTGEARLTVPDGAIGP